ncbi:NACHT and WD domain protein [Xylariales sp. PMI_506]|nr:NACHT and WD domain protein [Xylariales sp. PMI_506]
MLRRFSKRTGLSSQDDEGASGSWLSKLEEDETHAGYTDPHVSDPYQPAPTTSTRGKRHATFSDTGISAIQSRTSTAFRSSHRREPVDKLGLSLVHAVPEPLADLIFVHGLGGASWRTWSWQRDPRNFWPSWLGEEAELFRTRIFTFGYNADLAGQENPSNILDFARELLFQMKTYSGTKSMNNESIGQAYIIGKSDQQYAGIVDKIHAMLFLATPHRGSAYAGILNNVLRSSPGLSSKTYVSELEKTSTSLQDINEQFRNMCGSLQLVSLYETQKTAVALGIKKMIVSSDSAILGYPTEISSSLNADHHGVCKFSGANDPNYELVRNVLRMFMRKLKPLSMQSEIPGETDITILPEKKKLQELLSVHEDPNDDFELIRDRLMEGSCQWILQRPSYLEWKDLSLTGSKLLWLTGLPGAGKSVLSTFIINSLQNEDVDNCFYYFFKSEHQTKRSVSYMLSSIAYQTALASRPFRDQLLEKYDSGGVPSGRQKASSIWESVFESILFRQRFEQPIFWVIDGFDEADHPQLLLKLVSKLQVNTQFRILFVSRPMSKIALHTFSNIDVVHDSITIRDTYDDIRAYALAEISTTIHNEEACEDVCNRVLQKAEGSFLWTTLVINQLKENWHTQEDINQVLSNLPDGMELLYTRMMNSIADQPARPRLIASRILTWALCAFRPLELSELEVALAHEFGEFLSLNTTVTQTCGNFIRVERSRVILIHGTARNFLQSRTEELPLSIDYSQGHEHISETCLNFLMDPKYNWKRALAQSHPTGKAMDGRFGQVTRRPTWFDNHPFFSYAILCWSYHISLAPSSSRLAALVHEFLDQFCLVWINGIALYGDMKALARAAKYIKLFNKSRMRKSSQDSLESLKRTRDDELKQWSKDLIRVVGRFGNILAEKPLSIYKYIIPFCPSGSIINQTFRSMSSISVVGITSETWDDCLARLTMGGDEMATKVLCRGPYFVTLISHGIVIVWHADSCAEARRLDHKEWITVMECSRVSSLIVTAGATTIRVWDISTGEELYHLTRPIDRRILALSFSDTDEKLLIGYDDSSMQCVELDDLSEKWKYSFEVSGDSEHPCPHLVSISPDQYQVVLGYRGRPLFAWNLDSPNHRPQICTRPEDRLSGDNDPSAWKSVSPLRVIWRPGLPSVFILYYDATLFEWNIDQDIQKLIPDVGGIDMAISSDGNLLLTSDYNGTLSIWTVPEFRLTYRLEECGIVSSLAFSPDGQRFYDIRGPLCNVWEPEVLIRSDDLEELSSTQDTSVSNPISSSKRTAGAQITALVHDSEDKYYCCGKESGAVVMHEMETGKKIRKVYGHAAIASVIEMAWSRTSRFIASADDCGRVIVKRLRKPSPENNSWGVFPLLDFRPGDAISQLLFSPAEEYLLVSTSTQDYVWSLKSKKEVCRSDRWAGSGHKWLHHPSKPEILLLLDSGSLRIFKWATFVETRMWTLGPTAETNQGDLTQALDMEKLNIEKVKPRENKVYIEQPMAANGSQIIFDACPDIRTSRTHISHRQVMVLDIPSDFTTTKPRPAQGLHDHVNRLVGCFQGLVVFLNHQYCFCTWDIRIGSSSLKQHFHLPKDWLSSEMLKLCIVNKHGTILCPKNGEVAIIRHGIKF